MSIERTRLSVEFYLGRLRSQVDSLYGQQYPGDHPGPKLWLTLIVGILDTAKEYLAKSAITGPEAAEPTDAQDLVGDAGELARIAYKSLQFVADAGLEDLPYPIVRPLQRWFDQFGVKNSTFFHVEHSPIYELLWKEKDEFVKIRNKSKSLTEAIEAITWPLLRVTVPSKELGTIPHFSIVAHELGHAIYSDIPFDASAFDGPENRLTEAVYKHIRDGQDEDPHDFLRKVTAAWRQELAADAIAFYITGPALFFSLCEFFQYASGGYGLSDTHPPFDLRRRVLYSKLIEGGSASFAAILQRHGHVEFTENINSILLSPRPSKETVNKDMRKVFRPEKARVLAEMSDYIEAVAPVIYEQTEKFLKRKYPKQSYSPQQLDEDLENHLIPLLAAIPPIEKGIELTERSPTEFSTILNVGWVALLTKLKNLRVRVSEPDEFGSLKAECLHSLLLKAVELSETRRTWDAH